MVDLSGGQNDGHIEHRFNDWIFIGPGLLIVSLVGKFDRATLSRVDPRTSRGLNARWQCDAACVTSNTCCAVSRMITISTRSQSAAAVDVLSAVGD